MRHLPTVKVFVGTNDPLRDDILQFVHKLTYYMLIYN